jgi:hypothetical protein
MNVRPTRVAGLILLLMAIPWTQKMSHSQFYPRATQQEFRPAEARCQELVSRKPRACKGYSESVRGCRILERAAADLSDFVEALVG